MSQVQELFHEAAQQEALAQPQPWWKIQLFVWEPVLFGTWDGVFTSCMINIFGVVLFLRTGWLVGNTGMLMGMFLVSFVALVALVTVLSGIGVGEHCGVGSGGVYSMIASVLGGQTGGTIGLLYVFGQCVAGAMYITGFAESISDLLGLRNIWAVRGISVAVLLALLGINLAGVKWIIRLQLLLLLLLAVSTLDFVVGSFTHLDPAVPEAQGVPDAGTWIQCQDTVEKNQTWSLSWYNMAMTGKITVNDTNGCVKISATGTQAPYELCDYRQATESP